MFIRLSLSTWGRPAAGDSPGARGRRADGCTTRDLMVQQVLGLDSCSWASSNAISLVYLIQGLLRMLVSQSGLRVRWGCILEAYLGNKFDVSRFCCSGSIWLWESENIYSAKLCLLLMLNRVSLIVSLSLMMLIIFLGESVYCCLPGCSPTDCALAYFHIPPSFSELLLSVLHSSFFTLMGYSIIVLNRCSRISATLASEVPQLTARLVHAVLDISAVLPSLLMNSLTASLSRFSLNISNLISSPPSCSKATKQSYRNLHEFSQDYFTDAKSSVDAYYLCFDNLGYGWCLMPGKPRDTLFYSLIIWERWPVFFNLLMVARPRVLVASFRGLIGLALWDLLGSRCRLYDGFFSLLREGSGSLGIDFGVWVYGCSYSACAFFLKDQCWGSYCTTSRLSIVTCSIFSVSMSSLLLISSAL